MKKIVFLISMSLSVFGNPLSILKNSEISLGVDQERGGSISFLASTLVGQNIINSYDLGRQIQQSYYSGPYPFGKPHPAWKNWGWNPISSGDVYGNASEILELRNNGKSIYVKSRPKQWALNNIPCDCLFETWIELDGKAVRVKCRLTTERDDKTAYPPQLQEVPAIYTIGKLYRLFTYVGDSPFTGASVAEINHAGPPWTDWRASEYWAALVNDSDWGLGVVHKGAIDYIGGFHGKKNEGGPHDNSTGYIAPLKAHAIAPTGMYEYEYALYVGTLQEIRSFAYSVSREGAR